MERQNVISRLQQSKAELNRLGIEHIRLFGSLARDEAGPGSDVDLAATFNPEAKIGFRIVSIANRLEDILGAPVDLISYPTANEHIQSKIDHEGLHVF